MKKMKFTFSSGGIALLILITSRGFASEITEPTEAQTHGPVLMVPGSTIQLTKEISFPQGAQEVGFISGRMVTDSDPSQPYCILGWNRPVYSYQQVVIPKGAKFEVSYDTENRYSLDTRLGAVLTSQVMSLRAVCYAWGPGYYTWTFSAAQAKAALGNYAEITPAATEILPKK